VLWQDEINSRSGGEVSIDMGASGPGFQDQMQLIDDQVTPLSNTLNPWQTLKSANPIGYFLAINFSLYLYLLNQ